MPDPTPTPAPAPAPSAPSAPPAPADPQTKDVNINGQIFVLPVAEADKLIAARDGLTKSFNHVNSERETLAKQLADIEAARLAAESDAEKQKALSGGELDNLQKIHAKELQAIQDQLAAQTKANGGIRLRNIVSVRTDIPEIARADAAALIESSISEVIESNGQIHFKDHQGQLQEASVFVSQWLEAHPAFKAMKVPAGPNALPGGGDSDQSKPTITISEYTKRINEPDLVQKVTKRDIILIEG